MTDEMYKELKERLAEEGLICKRKDFNESVKGQAKRKELFSSTERMRILGIARKFYSNSHYA